MLTAAALALALLGGLWAWRAAAMEELNGATEMARGSDSDTCAHFDHSHATWTATLNRYVRDGLVDYASLKRNGQADLSAYLNSLGSICRHHYDTWSREQKLAFWINAYNAYTVRLILDHYPLKSIRSIGLLPSAAFRTEFIPLRALRGRTLSLNDIEHEILRKDFTEPRIHFAIVCASKGCPTIRSEAYRAADLDRQLDQAARSFVRDSAKNRFDAASRTLHLSSIFNWFREDFEQAARTLPDFVARYADESTASALRAGGVRIEFLDYDWSLNGR
ncbi:MAG: DUF547 domain-containing protein [Acidobacteriota bacterium]